MKKLSMFLTVFLLALFLFSSPAYACKNKPRIDYAYAEGGILHVHGSHFSERLGVKLGGEKLTLEGETEHNHIQAVIPDRFQSGGTFRLLVYKEIKRRYYWRSRRRSAQMDITLAATGQGNPGQQDPTGDSADTTPPTIENIISPTADLAFLETDALVSFDVKDDNEVALIGIHNVALPHKSKMVSAEPGLPSLSISEEIPMIPGDNTILIWAVDVLGNVTREMATVTRERNCVDCKLRALHMRGADFYGADLTRADLRDADLSDANLSMAELGGATLNAANLTNANLYGVKMVDASLKFTDLSGADLKDATISADMWGAIIAGADMRGANFGDANLANVDLRGANLTGAAMAGTLNLDSAIFGNTICPDGTNSDRNDGDRFTCLSNL